MGKNPNQEALKRARYIRVSGSQQNIWNDLEKIVKETKYSVQERLDSYAEAVIEEIQKQYKEINARSANRGRGFYAVRYNNRFERDPGEFITVTETAYGKSIQIEVDDPLYNILDQGRPDKQVTRLIRFPRYRGTVTTAGPDQIDLNTEPKYGTATLNDFLERWISGREESWVQLAPGKTLKGFLPRKLLNFAVRHALRGQLVEVKREKFAKGYGWMVMSTKIGYAPNLDFSDFRVDILDREARRNYKAEQAAKKAEEKRQALEKELAKRSRKKK